MSSRFVVEGARAHRLLSAVMAAALVIACDDDEGGGPRDAAPAADAGAAPDVVPPTSVGRADAAGDEAFVTPEGPLVVDLALHDFDIAAGTVGARTFTFTNTGTATLAQLTTGATPTIPELTLVDTCRGQVLPPGASCTIEARWAPAVAMSLETTLFVATGGYRVEVTLYGRARASGAPTVTPSTYDFGHVPVGTRTAPVEFSVTNYGNIASPALAATLINPQDFQISYDGCTGRSLAPGETCAVGILFAPSTARQQVTMLSFTVVGGGASSTSLSGTGVADADAGISP